MQKFDFCCAAWRNLCPVVVAIFLATALGDSAALAQQENAKPQSIENKTSDNIPKDNIPKEKQRIVKLVEQLGNTNPAIREHAQAQLTKIGFAAFDKLSAVAENHPDIEVSTRAAYLIRHIPIDWLQDDDHSDVKRLLKHYETLNTKARLEVISKLSKLSPKITTAALCRLVRYEKSQLLSKWAATKIIDRDLPEPDVLKKISTAIDESLGPCDRAGARLLRAYAIYSDDAKKSMKAWDEVIDREFVTLRDAPQDTNRQLIRKLLERQFELLDHQHQRDAALAVAQRMVAIQPSDADSLRQFIHWLTKRKAWPVIESVAQRFKKNIHRDAILLYSLAQSYKAEGKSELAKQAADRAITLNPTEAPPHVIAAYRLQESGMFVWAEREYFHALSIGPKNSVWVLRATRWLAIMLHDQQQDKKASDVLQDLVDLAEKDIQARRRLNEFGQSVKESKTQLHFYRACHYRTTGDVAKQAKELAQAIEYDPTDADVLIAMYRLPQQTPEFQANIKKRIADCAAIFEEQLAKAKGRNSDLMRATACNQYAWLISNTEGDYKKALRYSMISNDIRPESAGNLDTLGRCYYAVGDLKNAVRIQAKANRLEPHSGAIARQLKFFKEEAAQANGETDRGQKADDGPLENTPTNNAQQKQADDVE